MDTERFAVISFNGSFHLSTVIAAMVSGFPSPSQPNRILTNPDIPMTSGSALTGAGFRVAPLHTLGL